MTTNRSVIVLVGGLALCGAAAISCPTTIPFTFATIAANAGMALTPNIAADLFSRFADWIGARYHGRGKAKKGHDLRELVAVAIESVMEDVVTRGIGGKEGRRIVKQWRLGVRDRLVWASVDDRFCGTWEQTAAHYFKSRLDEFEHVRALTPNIWMNFLNEITYSPLSDDAQTTLKATATALHENLPKRLVGVYCDSFSNDPIIYVAVQTAILQEIWNEAARAAKASDRVDTRLATVQNEIRQMGNVVASVNPRAFQSLTKEFTTEGGEFRVLSWTIEFLARDTNSMLKDLIASQPVRDKQSRRTFRAVKRLNRTINAQNREQLRKRCRASVEGRIQRLLGDSIADGRSEPRPYQPRSMLMSDNRRVECVRVFMEQFVGNDTLEVSSGTLQRNCFTITGRTGHGKTTLVCKMAEAACARDNTICIFLQGRSLQNHDLKRRGSRYEIAANILAELNQHAPATASGENVLAQLVEYLHYLTAAPGEPWRVIVFLDAINEAPHQSAEHLADLSAELFEIMQAVADGPDRLANRLSFCISCREEYWRHFNGLAGTPAWSQFIWNSALPQAPSLRLDVYDDEELQQAKNAYFRRYQLSVREPPGGTQGSRLDALLREPVLLRYFCEAYGSREPGVAACVSDDPTRITRITIFERMAQTYRESILPHQGGAVETLTTRMHPTTALLLNLANVMHSNRRLTFTAQEAHECAIHIKHPDIYTNQDGTGRQLTIQEFVKDPRSSFARMIAERIVVEREPGSNTYSFIFDSYYEFSLGRYIAHIRWAQLEVESHDPIGAITADLRELLRQAAHGSSVAHPDVTTHRAELFSAIYYAVLLVERGGLFANRQELFWKLEGVLLEATQDHLWRQQGLAILRDSQFALPQSWTTSAACSSTTTQRDRLDTLLKQMHAILDGADHVCVWDIEVTLRHLSNANRSARGQIISTVTRWARESVNNNSAALRLRRMAAARILSGLRLPAEDSIFDDYFAHLIASPVLTTDFWSARSLVSVARTVATTAGRSGLPDPVRRRYFAHLLRIIRRNLTAERRTVAGRMGQVFPEAVAVRAISYRAAIAIASRHGDHLQRLQSLLSTETHPWIWWSLAHELKQTSPSLEPEFVRWIIGRCERVNSPHVQQALRCLANGAIVCERMPGMPAWGSIPNPARRSLSGNSAIAIIYHPIFLDSEHRNHPECRERLASTLFALDTLPSLEWHEPFLATESHIARAHNENSDMHRGGAAWSDYLDQIKASSVREDVESLPSGALEMRPGIYRDACYSAGAAVAAVEVALQSGSRYKPFSAWAVHRPPGHLANNTICVFNNAAIAALHARIEHDVSRILVIDFDAHHGRHTERVFYHRSDVVYLSLHIDDPYTKEAGSIDRIGTGDGRGYTFNLPYAIPPDDHAYVRLAAEFVGPAIRQFCPNLIVFSAGFDALASDPLTPHGGHLTVEGYRGFARVLRTAVESLRTTQNVHIAGCLEGGYSLEELGLAFAGFISEFTASPHTDTIRIKAPGREANRAVTDVIERRLKLVDQHPTAHFSRELFVSYRVDPASCAILMGSDRDR